MFAFFSLLLIRAFVFFLANCETSLFVLRVVKTLRSTEEGAFDICLIRMARRRDGC